MKNFVRIGGVILTLVMVMAAGQCFAQSASDLKINEVLVINDSNFVDSYGERNGWIEIFNSAYNSVDIGGMYLTDDPSNPKKYWIPKGDPITKIAPRHYILFYANNNPTRGIQYLNFHLKENGYLALYESNGRTLIDEIKLGDQKSDISYGRLSDGGNEWGFLEKTTPGANNYTGVKVTAGEKFVLLDPYGIGMAVIAMSVVFLALILLYLIFKHTKGLYTLDMKTLFRKKDPAVIAAPVSREEISGEVNAAIAMALHMYVGALHDHEETVLTIKRVARTYSPWSSKIYGLRNVPR